MKTKKIYALLFLLCLSSQAHAFCIPSGTVQGQSKTPSPDCDQFDDQEAEDQAYDGAQRQCSGADGTSLGTFSIQHGCEQGDGTYAVSTATAQVKCCYQW